MSTPRPSGQALTALGALALGVSAFFNWFDDLDPTEIATRWLFWSDTQTTTDELASMAVPLLAAGLIALLGALIASRLLGGLGLLVGLATAVTWVVRTADVESGFGVGDLQEGAWIAFGGLVLLLIGVAGLRRPAEDVRETMPSYTTDPTAGPTPTQ
ncbi:MAG: hypothetical protein ACRD07_23425 [Acidimicrobiales bacterium]